MINPRREPARGAHSRQEPRRRPRLRACRGEGSGAGWKAGVLEQGRGLGYLVALGVVDANLDEAALDRSWPAS